MINNSSDKKMEKTILRAPVEKIRNEIQKKVELGSQEIELIVNCRDVPFETCVNDEYIHETLMEAAKLMGMKIRASASYNCGRATPPGSICFVMVDQSFVYAHSFADFGTMAIRVFTCGEADPMVGWNFIRRRLGIKNFTVKKEQLR